MFDEAKKKINNLIDCAVDIAEQTDKVILLGEIEALRREILAVLGDLHHAWCAEAQKTVKWLECYPKAVCLVGSTHPKWKKRYRQVEEELTKAGFVVLSVVWFKDQLPKFESHRDLLERIHFQKIRLADAVVLIHKDAVGKHTAMEMEFAENIGRKVVVFDTIEKAGKLLEPQK